MRAKAITDRARGKRAEGRNLIPDILASQKERFSYYYTEFLAR
jgi:hypothetical protein